jgi:hypothetical protein
MPRLPSSTATRAKKKLWIKDESRGERKSLVRTFAGEACAFYE